MKTLSSSAKKRERGFTLLETIVTLTIAAILGTVLVTYMGTALTRSGEPVIRSQQLYELQQVMENIKSTHLRNVDATDALVRLQKYVCPNTDTTATSCIEDYTNYRIVAKGIIFDKSPNSSDPNYNYVERTAATKDAGYSLKVTVASTITSGLSVTEVFVQKPL